MAYVDFTDELTSTVPLAAPRADPVPDGDRLSALEWSVVALAQQDRLSSLGTPGRLSVALGRVFGTRRRGLHLADPRLEALRRMAVLTWHRGFAVPASEVAAFLRAGFSVGQYEAMTASISIARDRRSVRA